MNSYIPEMATEPPKEEELESRLNENEKIGNAKMDMVLSDFTRKQLEVNEQTDEIPNDKPVHEPEDEIIFPDREKRDNVYSWPSHSHRPLTTYGMLPVW